MENNVDSELVEFIEWYALRKSQIPSHHHKEILQADFKGQGLRDKETVAAFDKALLRYGVKLK